MNSPSNPGAKRGRRYAQVTLAVMLLAFPLIVFGARSALRSTSNDPRQWLPRKFAETDTYDWFELHFGSDEIAVVSWPGCTLDDPRIGVLDAALEGSPFFDRVLTGPEVVEELTAPPLDLTRKSAIRRLQGILVEADGATTCLVLSISSLGKNDRMRAVREIEIQAAEKCRIDASELRLAGPTVDAAAIDAESRHLLFHLAGISALVSFVVASLRLESIRMAIMILLVSVYCTALSLAILFFTGGEMNLLMTMLPPLIYVLSISSAVHLANYYRDAVTDPDVKRPLRAAVKQGWLPCTLAATTTGIGLASLVLSKIDPIRTFGIYSAIGVVVSVGVLFLMLPSAIYLFPPKKKPAVEDNLSRRRLSQSIIAVIRRDHMTFTVICLAVMIFCGSVLPNIQSTVRLQDRFLANSDPITDYMWLEKHIGPMVPLEIVIHFDSNGPQDFLDQMRLVASVQRRIQTLNEPVATMSAVNLSPPLPKGRTVREVVARKVITSQRTQDRLTEANFLAEADGERLWRISVRARAIGDLDYGEFAETLRQRVDPLLIANNVHGTYTGVIPLIYKAQRQLLEDLFRSFLAAFAVIAVVLVVVLRSAVAALLAMIPNLFPAVVVFGGIEWVDIPVQIGSVMTASAALGIAVDDTVHFLTWFRRGLDRGLSRGGSLGDAFQRCSGAMAHTTLICSSGLLVFALSTFVPILHFAWLMVFLLLAALVGDLVLLPALLAGPLGRTFKKADRYALKSD